MRKKDMRSRKRVTGYGEACELARVTHGRQVRSVRAYARESTCRNHIVLVVVRSCTITAFCFIFSNCNAAENAPSASVGIEYEGLDGAPFLILNFENACVFAS